jgi:hypothetical protein
MLADAARDHGSAIDGDATVGRLNGVLEAVGASAVEATLAAWANLARRAAVFRVCLGAEAGAVAACLSTAALRAAQTAVVFVSVCVHACGATQGGGCAGTALAAGADVSRGTAGVVAAHSGGATRAATPRLSCGTAVAAGAGLGRVVAAGVGATVGGSSVAAGGAVADAAAAGVVAPCGP